MQTTQLLGKFLVSISQFKTKFEELFSYGLQREALTSIKLGTYMLLVGAKNVSPKIDAKYEFARSERTFVRIHWLHFTQFYQ